MHAYKFNQITGGYRYNIFERCLLEVGIFPDSIYDIYENERYVTYIQFNRELTELELNALTTLMNNNPQFPPTSNNTVFYIKDIVASFAQFEADFGIGLKLYYSETITGSGIIDRLELHASKVLTAQEKNKLRGLYSGLITEKTS